MLNTGVGTTLLNQNSGQLLNTGMGTTLTNTAGAQFVNSSGYIEGGEYYEPNSGRPPPR